MNIKTNNMNTQLENYLDLLNKVDRIEKLTNGDRDTRYYLEKIIPPLWTDGFDVEDIIDYITIKIHSTITKLEEQQQIVTTNTK